MVSREKFVCEVPVFSKVISIIPKPQMMRFILKDGSELEISGDEIERDGSGILAERKIWSDAVMKIFRL